mgnify:CR=1 FL=1
MANAPRAVLPRTEFDRYGNKRSKLDTDLRMVKASFNSQIRKIKVRSATTRARYTGHPLSRERFTISVLFVKDRA